MRTPIRILQATVSNDKGGLTGYICQNYRFINRENFQFDFLTYEEKIDFEEEFKLLGAKFYRVPHPNHFWEYYHALKKIRGEGHSTIIHFNLSYANPFPLLAAKLAGFERIIVHSHSSGIDERNPIRRNAKCFLHHVGKLLIPRIATDFWACSQLAAKWMFPEKILQSGKYQLMHNAIDVEKWRYDEIVRKKVRRSLGISAQTFCVGHVGRFSYQKNQAFLIKVFGEICKKNPDSCLLLIGGALNGEAYLQEAHNLVKQLHLESRVKFLGIRDDINQLMQAMDCFVLPSRFEGLGIVAVEAQAAGLPCYLSNKIPYEVQLTPNLYFFSLTRKSTEWAEYILQSTGKLRSESTGEITDAGYNIREEIKNIESFYLRLKLF